MPLCRAVCFTSKIQSVHNSVTLQSGLFHVKKYSSVQNRCHSTERSVSRQNTVYAKQVLQSCLFHVQNTVNAKQVSLYRAVCFTLKTVSTKQVSLPMCSKTPMQTIEAHKENNSITPNENTVKTYNENAIKTHNENTTKTHNEKERKKAAALKHTLKLLLKRAMKKSTMMHQLNMLCY